MIRLPKLFEANGYYGAPAATAALRQQAVARGLSWHVVDQSHACSKQAVLKAWAKALHFPAGWGGNWDALADCLQDLSWDRAPGCIVWLRGASWPAAADLANAAVLRDILETTAAYWRRRERVFIVLAEGATDLPRWNQP